jgi:nitrous oxidase accessory protein
MNKDSLFPLLIMVILFFTFGDRGATASPNPIQALIDQAKVGATIHIPDGIYKGSLVVNKTVKLIGDGRVTIDGGGVGNVITISAPSVTIENLTLVNGGSQATEDLAGIMLLSDGNSIKNIKIEKTLHGIYLKRSNGNTILNCVIEGDKRLSRARRGNGIHLFYSQNNTLKNNAIFGVRDGIYFSFSERNILKENKISQNRYGLHYMYSDKNEFYRNHFYENGGGAAIMYSNDIVLKENAFYNNKGIHSFGILLQSSNQVKLTKNRLYENKIGIFMDLSEDNFLSQNIIQNNKIGAEVWGSSVGNTFTQNKFLSNTIPIVSNGNDLKENQWDYKQIGNLWSGDVKVDFNEDGIDDSPYVYTSRVNNLLTNNQLLYLFLDSPSFQLYKYINKGVSNQAIFIDHYPLVTEKNRPSLLFPFLFLMILGTVSLFMKQIKRRNGR